MRTQNNEHNLGVYWTLTVRHFKVFFKNKLMFFFSLLVPLITLIIYIIFLRQLEVNSIDNVLKDCLQGVNYTEEVFNKAHVLADAWMLSGIIIVSTISVSLNTCYIMVEDREKGVNRDFVSSPISRRSINLSYFLFTILATLLVTFCVLIICFIALAIIGGGLQISFGNALLTIPILILSVISASLVTCFIGSFVSTNAIFNSFVAIISSAAGFLIGAFMPITMLPPVAEKITLFFPGTYCAGLMRTYFLTDYYSNFKAYLSEIGASSEKIAEIEQNISKSFSMDIDFFGYKVTPGFMVLAIFLFIVLFLILDYIFIDRNFDSSLVGKIKKTKKKK